ncbi:hypothetical protein SADUNF_Sadunf11G0015300 [Salix dunnii]|uniref:Uncharacterized protein n=1 Tax=Salix dunnii TaxID=1413687 RepID=A0A835JPH7_9ROSI|nr:hypothetical protein SADUNF_Sadunf11G0015300 [Salix dunnii]
MQETEPMASSSRFLFSLCLLFMKVLALAKAQQPADQPVMLLYKDSVGKGNYTTNSTYQANLNQLLTSIYTNTDVAEALSIKTCEETIGNNLLKFR